MHLPGVKRQRGDQDGLFERAKRYREQHTHRIDTRDAFGKTERAAGCVGESVLRRS
jgi:hypothetical protein